MAVTDPKMFSTYTQWMKDMVNKGVYDGPEPIAFSQDMPVGAVAHWNNNRVIIRVSDVAWNIMDKKV